MIYQDYLLSKSWKDLKLEYQASGRAWECRICKTKKDINLHHRRYDTLGEEDIKKDVVPLCVTHHAQVHWDDLSGKTPLDYYHLYKREQKLYKQYNSLWARLGRFRLGLFINSLFT